MKKLILSLIVAISLAVGVAGSAAALPDNHACAAASATPGITALAAIGGCGSHP